VSYRTVDSPLGLLLLAATGEGLVRVAFSCEDHDTVLARLASDISPRILRTPRRLDEAAHQLDEYFAASGARSAYRSTCSWRTDSVARARPPAPHSLRRDAKLCRRGQGGRESVRVRAAASACSHNPIPLVVPCHRVVRSDGTTGEYLAGPEAKRTLLAMEAAA